MTVPLLDREEYVEQAYFFRVYRERIEDAVPSQEVLSGLKDELLATTKLPTVVEFLSGEMQLHGRIGDGMLRLPHYFTPFQTFLMRHSEEDDTRFDTMVALKILEREAEYKAEKPSAAALFVYQFECIARNRLGYDDGLIAMAQDPLFNADWEDWLRKLRRQVGSSDFAELIYLRSEHAVIEQRRQLKDEHWESPVPILFGAQEGRIAKAHRYKDPLYMFAALQRHLGYPVVPRPPKSKTTRLFEPHVDTRFQRVEQRLQLIESELKGGIDLSQFYKGQQPPKFTDENE